MQTISRANRVFAEKHSGLIVDYVGVFRRLEEALAIYGAPSGGSADDLVLPKEKLVEALTEAETDLRASLTGYGADIDALIAAGGFDYAKRLADTAELVLAAGEEERRSFVNRTNRFMRIYRAALPNPDAFAFSRVASALRMIVKRVQLATPAADISEVMERINVLLDESIATEGFLIPDLPDEERIVDLSGVDWDALQEATTRRYTAAERIKQLLAERTSRIARTNPTYEELAEKFENLVEAYNNGSVNIEELLRRLRALVGELDEYERRLVTEDLTEEQLAVFDLLTKPEPELTDEQQAQVKGLARELFAHIEEALVLDWRKHQEGRGRVRVALETHLDQLPDVYEPDLFNNKCGLVYEYVFSRGELVR
jgi:type I restriction enzyme R subunit